jgi:hypothetical protein
MRSLNGSPVDPEAAGCCVGLTGAGPSGYASCTSEPTTSGHLVWLDTGEMRQAFTCDRHAVVLTQPRPLSVADLAEMDRRQGLRG